MWCAEQLVFHLDQHDLLGKFRSAYRPGHSCETAILRALNVLCSADGGDLVFLVLVDLSAAFDTMKFSWCDCLMRWAFPALLIRGFVLTWGTQPSKSQLTSHFLKTDLSRVEFLRALCWASFSSPLTPLTWQNHKETWCLPEAFCWRYWTVSCFPSRPYISPYCCSHCWEVLSSCKSMDDSKQTQA